MNGFNCYAMVPCNKETIEFHLSYMPPYMRRITQSSQLLFRGKYKLEEMKQLRLETCSGGPGFQCHVFFPHMPVRSKGDAHLTDKE